MVERLVLILFAGGRASNVAQLVLGYGAAQALMFVAQSCLILSGKSAILGRFGLTYTINTLLYQIVDWGAIVVMATYVLRYSSDNELASAFFWRFSCFRAAVALLCGVAGCGIAYLSGDQLAVGFSLTTCPGLLAFAFNLGGILDGVRRSGLTGLTSAIPVACCAGALITGQHLPHLQYGLLLGAAYSAGTLATVAAQAWLCRLGDVRLRGPKLSDLRFSDDSWREGALFLLSTMPGQFFYRGQLAIGGIALGASALGHLVYAKQITNVGLQFLYFVRRAEFPNLLARLSSGREPPLRAIFRTQSVTLVLSLAGALVLLVLGIALQHAKPQLSESGYALKFFSLVLVAGGFFSIMNQAYAAARRLGPAAAAASGMLLLGLLLCWLLRVFGLPGLAVAEALANAAAALVLAAALGTGLVSTQHAKLRAAQ